MKIKTFIILTFLFLSTISINADRQDIKYPNNIVSESMKKKLEELRIDEIYKGHGGLNNYYARFINNTGTINHPLLLITGAEDPTPIWYRTVAKAIEHGFKNIYIIEIRGQGLSQRVTNNSRKLIHINNFQNYYKDFILALKHINRHETLNTSVYVISHSTGSMVLLNSLAKINKAIPTFKIKAMSFWAPLIRLHLSSMLDNTVVPKIVSKLENLYQYCCGLFVYKKYKRNSFNKNKLTGSLSRYNSYQDLMYNYGHGSTGLSLAWAIGVIKELHHLQRGDINTIKIPTLNLQAELDKIVNNDYEFKNNNIETYVIKGSKHSFNLESDPIFDDVIKRTFNFILNH
jgi:alpha-beta hydrolase superfamily lysophospholipase